MEHMNKMRKFQLIRTGLIGILVGVLFVVIGIIALSRPQKDLTELTATVVEIETYYNQAEQQTGYNVYIDYEAGGKTYRHVLSPSYSSKMQVGDEMSVFCDPDDPTVLSSTDSNIIIYVLIAVGALSLIGGAVMLVKNIGKRPEEYDQYNKVDMSSVSPELVQEIEENDEEMQRFWFHPGKGPKQGYIMEDSAHRVVMDAKPDEINIVKASPYTFTNHLTLSTKKMMIGLVFSTSVGSGSFNYRVPISSAFKIDGVANWDWLAERGYGFDCEVTGLKPCFEVKHYGVKTAYIETTGINQSEDGGKKSRLGGLPVNGYFRIDCRSSEIEDIFMICFSIAKAMFNND